MTTTINTRPRTNAENGAQVRGSSSGGAAYKVLRNVYVRVVPLGLRERIWVARHRREFAIARHATPATPSPGSLEAALQDALRDALPAALRASLPDALWEVRPDILREVTEAQHRRSATAQALAKLDPKARADLITQLMQPFIQSSAYLDHFANWEEAGFHVTPNHFYQPVPDIREISEEVWTQENALAGISMNEEEQLRFAREVVPLYQPEFARFPEQKTDDPTEFTLSNTSLTGMDAAVLHCMMRHYKPRRIIEAGSGASSLVIAAAARLNGNAPDYTIIDPYPGDVVAKGLPGVSRVIKERVERVDRHLFSTLRDGDLLFIDTSHVVKTGGDVNYLFLHVLPQLNEGVVVHVHDIFLPYEYPRRWLAELRYFWTEQYLLQAFLVHNAAFEVLFGNNYMARRHQDAVALFPKYPWDEVGGGSFWLPHKSALA